MIKGVYKSFVFITTHERACDYLIQMNLGRQRIQIFHVTYNALHMFANGYSSVAEWYSFTSYVSALIIHTYISIKHVCSLSGYLDQLRVVAVRVQTKRYMHE